MRLTLPSITVAGLALLGVASAIPADQSLDIAGFAYEYAVVAVQQGVPVQWRNLDNAAHTVTSAFCSWGCSFDSGTMGTSETFAFTPTSGGKVRYFCRVHAQMEGELFVQTGDPADPDLHLSSSAITVRNARLADQVPIPYRYEISVVVRNDGDPDTNAVLTVDERSPVGAITRLASTTLHVSGQATATATVTWDAATAAATKPGEYHILAKVDAGNLVVESDETDNEAAYSFTIAPGGIVG